MRKQMRLCCLLLGLTMAFPIAAEVTFYYSYKDVDGYEFHVCRDDSEVWSVYDISSGNVMSWGAGDDLGVILSSHALDPDTITYVSHSYTECP